MITADMVDKAEEAYDDVVTPDNPASEWQAMKASLAAVAPMIIAVALETRPPALLKDALDKTINKARAQGMREAIEMADDNDFDNWNEWQIAVLERAQELDPGNDPLIEPQAVVHGKARVRRAQEPK